jgi:biopolymer transport protein ExbD
MAGGGFQDDEEIISGINVTPLVDITLVLLIIFMVTTPMIMKPSINVNLPKAASSDQSAPGEMNITISKDGDIYLNGERIGEIALKLKASDIATAKPDAQAMISADKDTPHGVVINVIDIVKTAGIKRFAINIEKKPE